MRRLIPLGLALVALLGGGDAPAQTGKAGVRDEARMFSPEAVRDADREIQDIRRASRWEVAVKTINSLEGEDVKDRAIKEAKSLNVHGLLVLIAKKDHKVWIAPSDSARGTFTHDRTSAIAKTLSDDFRAGEFDRGLRGALAEIHKDVEATSKATVTKPKEIDLSPAPAPAPPAQRNPMAGPPIER